MAEPILKVVDLGTKLGNSITEFIRRGEMYFGSQVRDIALHECLGVDKQERFRSDLESRGMLFQHRDLTDEGVLESLPEADFYLAWDFLEHLPDKEWASAVIQTMLHKARRGVWLRMPSFEQDEGTGEGVLKKMGLRFTWTRWHGHKCPLLVAEAVSVIKGYRAQTGRSSINVKVKPGKRVRATDDPCVVPLDAPEDTTEYSSALGPKTVKDLETNLVGQWEVIVKV